ncbi:MAG: DNA repair protein RecN [Chthonomonadales bacterium]
MLQPHLRACASMLLNLAIRNFAIIDQLEIEFGAGLNVLSGETGAGKSIIVGALTLLLGGRTNADIVRTGADHAVVDGVFDVSSSPRVCQAASSLGFEVEEGRLLLSREVTAAGRSAARIMGRPATLAQIRELGDLLIDLHGQHEHQSLLSVPRHLDILDEWAGEDVAALRQQVSRVAMRLKQLEGQQSGVERDARERLRLMDLCRYQVDEITAAGLYAGEEEELRADERRLANAQSLAEASSSAYELLAGEGGALEQLAATARLLGDGAHLDEALQPAWDAVRAAQYQLQEVARDLLRYREGVEFNPARLEQIQDRLEQIRALKRKYGDTVEEVLQFALRARDTLATLEAAEEQSHELEAELKRCREEFRQLCSDLSYRRRQAGKGFADAVLRELADLAMEKTRFEVAIEDGEPGERGADRVEFLIAPNVGEAMRPLARIASGGEISRVMLAIKSAMAAQDTLPTMVFDEIDVGVGGRTASVVASKLKALAEKSQVLCITHLPQIAARASRHYLIEKEPRDGRTSVRVTLLGADDRVREVARMMAGSHITDTALRHARELLQVP